MTDISEQIKKIEKEIRETPYHKATEHHIGLSRAKLSKLKAKQIEFTTKKGGSGVGYAVKKQGDATVTLVGEPSVGKSTLLNRLTNAKSKIAPYAFTTVSVVPGMMTYRDARIQILDVPGLMEGAEQGKGRGKEVISVARGSDLLIILCDVKREESLGNISNSLESSGIRINKIQPNVNIEKKLKGGIFIHSNIKQDLDKKTIIGVGKEFRIVNAEITIKEKLTMDQLIDAFSPDRVYIPAIFVINKIDLIKNKDNGNSDYRDKKVLYISAEDNINIDLLKKLIWKNLGLVRIYLVRQNEKPSLKNPIIMKEGTTLYDVAEKIGTEFAEEKSKAKIWKSGAKYPHQEVSLKTKIQDGMQVRFI